MSKNYTLVNPYVIGSMNKSFNASSSVEAAKLAYSELSQYFGNHMPVFRFTLKKMNGDNSVIGGSSKDFIHFEANENKDKDNRVTYEIKKIDGNNLKGFQSRLDKVANQDHKKTGGAKNKKSAKTKKTKPKSKKNNESEDNSDNDRGNYVEKNRSPSYDDDLSDYFDSDIEGPRKGPLTYDPIVYYWYDPFVYPTMDRWYIPQFVLPILPRVVIDAHSLGYARSW
jgi:hypothetical protein